MIPLKDIRQAALALWMAGTQRTRQNLTDRYFIECQWQTNFSDPNADPNKHYSIFCSMGDWNTNLTDVLEDSRFDHIPLDGTPEEKDIVFRFYTKVYLIASEILTDFQDILSVFRTGNIQAPQNSDETRTSRNQLTPTTQPGAISDTFEYINSVCKHKTRNLHSCNHHILYYFEDIKSATRPVGDYIDINNVRQILTQVRNGQLQRLPDTVIVPYLDNVIALIVHCYGVLNQAFMSDPAKFQAFCLIYEGQSVRLSTPATAAAP